jgi:maltose O-acetyltransferase
MDKISDLLLNVVTRSSLCPRQLRRAIYRLLGMKIGVADIWPGVTFSGRCFSLGDGSWINRGTYVDCRNADVVIGKNVGVAMGVTFVTSSHQMGTPERRAGTMQSQPITVEDGVWICACAVILPGCTIGRGSVIAAGAVVTQSCAPNGLYAGVPAKRVRDV